MMSNAAGLPLPLYCISVMRMAVVRSEPSTHLNPDGMMASTPLNGLYRVSLHNQCLGGVPLPLTLLAIMQYLVSVVDMHLYHTYKMLHCGQEGKGHREAPVKRATT